MQFLIRHKETTHTWTKLNHYGTRYIPTTGDKIGEGLDNEHTALNSYWQTQPKKLWTVRLNIDYNTNLFCDHITYWIYHET